MRDAFRRLPILHGPCGLGAAVLARILSGRILLVVHVFAALRRILPVGVSYVAGIVLLPLARILLVLFGLVAHEFLLFKN